MKHGDKVKKLSRNTSHRRALLRNLAESLYKYESIKTTIDKAKTLRPYAEKIITKAKTDNLSNRRLIAENIHDKKLQTKLFTDIAKRYANRHGGYTRIYRLGFRATDGAEMAMIELVEETLAKK
jgi:large subunit ribosomal protein L17